MSEQIERRLAAILTSYWVHKTDAAKRLFLAIIIAGTFLLSGCFDGTVMKVSSHRVWLKGKIYYQANHKSYQNPVTRAGAVAAIAIGEVPTGTSGVPFLYVCVHQWQGNKNPEDDKTFGCARTNEAGAYELKYRAPLTAKQYLVTWFCDNDDIGPPARAEVCVRNNIKDFPALGRPNGTTRYGFNIASHHRKWLYSSNFKPSPSLFKTVNWNLSCPNTASPALGPGCPASDLDPEGPNGSTNSNSGYNIEAIHAFRAAVEPIVSFGSMKPNAANTSKHPNTWSNPWWCTDARCQSPIEVYLRETYRATRCLDGGPCVTVLPTAYGADDARGLFCGTDGIQGADDFDRVCITSPMNPFRVAHEFGHSVSMRWWQSNRGSKGCPANDPGGPNLRWFFCSENAGMHEGWADFFGTATWFSQTAANPAYYWSILLQNSRVRRPAQLPMENPIPPRLPVSAGNTYPQPAGNANIGSCRAGLIGWQDGSTRPATAGYNVGTGRISQFLWDLYDDNNFSLPTSRPRLERDTATYSFAQIRAVLNRFVEHDRFGRKRVGNHQAEEQDKPVRDDKGRNGLDYLFHFLKQYGDPVSVKKIALTNCIVMLDPN